MKKSALQQSIAQLLFDNQDGFNSATIARELDANGSTVFNELKAMSECGLIEKIEKIYVISDFGIATFGLKRIEKSPLSQNEKEPVKTVAQVALEQKPKDGKVPNMTTAELRTYAMMDARKAKSNTTEKINQPIVSVVAVDAGDIKRAVEIIAASCGVEAEPVVSEILPDLRHKPIPVNVKTDVEIKAHINNTVTDAGEHYRLEYRGVKIDPFRIAQVYGINDFAMMTVLKKVLRAGRAHKDLRQDLLDMKCAIDRKLEMMAEDNAFA